MSAKDKMEENLLGWSDIKDHLPRLREAAKGHCFEIGVRGGMSTSALLAGIEEHGGHLWSVDIDDCNVFPAHPNWTFVRSNSSLDAERLKNSLPESLDLLFVDGDHTYEGAFSDLSKFGPMAKRIFVHDTEAPDYPGVRQAVEEFAKQFERKVIWHSGSFGMAEIE